MTVSKLESLLPAAMGINEFASPKMSCTAPYWSAAVGGRRKEGGRGSGRGKGEGRRQRLRLDSAIRGVWSRATVDVFRRSHVVSDSSSTSSSSGGSRGGSYAHYLRFVK